MERKPDERLSSDLARQVCRRQGLKGMIVGSIASLGSHYVIAINALNCTTGDSIASAHGEAGSKEEVLRTLGAAATTLRGKLGESLASIEQYNAPVEAATTSSFAALEAFSRGQTLRDQGNDRAAIPLLKRAVELDSNFSLAYARLGSAYDNERQTTPAREYLTKAYGLRNRASERERLYIEARYTDVVTGDLPTLIEIYSRWRQTYPRDATPAINLGLALSWLGDSTKAIDESVAALKINPNQTYAYGNLANMYLDLGRLDEAQVIIDQAAARKLDDFMVHLAMLRLALGRDDADGVRKTLDWFRSRYPTDHFGFQLDLATKAGRMQDARVLAQQSIASATAEGDPEGAAERLLRLALAEALYGNLPAAHRLVPKALSMSSERTLLGRAARVLAEAGDVPGARTLVEQAARELAATDTMERQIFLSTVRAICWRSGRMPTAICRR